MRNAMTFGVAVLGAVAAGRVVYSAGCLLLSLLP